MNTAFNDFADANGLKADDVASATTTPEIYYDGDKYLMMDSSGIFRRFPESHIKDHLISIGFSAKAGDEGLSQVKKELLRIRSMHRIVASGNYAGYSQGIVKRGGDQILATHPFNLAQPKKGEWTLLNRLLLNLLGEEQLMYFLAWLHVFIGDLFHANAKRSAEALRPGQAMILIGPAGCGKSLLSAVLAAIFDGPVARPYQFMSGDTRFNNDLAESCILALDDEGLSRRASAREGLTARIKQMTVVNESRLEAKYQNPVVVPLRNRLLILLNDQPKSLMVLPDFDESVRDKLMLFKAMKAEMPMRVDTLEARQGFFEEIRGELSAFVHYVINEFEIDEKIKSARYGVREYHHPDVVELLYERDPCMQVLELIDTAFSKGGLIAHQGVWKGSAQNLERKLAELYRDKEMSRLLPVQNSLGMYLATLSRTDPSRVEGGTKINGYKQWIIRTQPEQTQPESERGDESTGASTLLERALAHEN